MSDPFDFDLSGMMEDLRRQREQMVELQRRIGDIAVTVTARKGAIRVTVGAQGQITNLSFPTQAYRTMAPAELASMITEAVGDARVQAAEQMSELLGPLLPEGFSLPDMTNGTTDFESLLPDVTELFDAKERRDG